MHPLHFLHRSSRSAGGLVAAVALAALSACAADSLPTADKGVTGTPAMTIIPAGSRVPTPAPSQYFVGTARVAPMFAGSAPSRLSSGQVTFEAGARSAWHTHPAGQMLVVTSGNGWIQQEGQPKRDIRQGDVIWTPPGIKHWHGATPDGSMTHLAIQESLDGKNVNWLEPVSDDQYRQ